MKLLEFEYDGYECYLPKGIPINDPNWIGIYSPSDGSYYMVYDKDNNNIATARNPNEAFKLASKYYFDKHKKN